tara:strand:+ start:740 stop:1324 length:585 start_codon:yes stop_codon:yes gene_type:complete
MKKILIVTGPQGSGNHCWSKIFSQHSEVCGWNQLTKQYWVGHDQEPFFKYWHDPSLLYKLSWDKKYYFTNMSVPNGGDAFENKAIPKVGQFIETFKDIGFEVQVAITSRDKNILELQQTRRWNYPTTNEFINILDDIPDPIFLSYESLLLYKEKYVQSLKIKIPIDFSAINGIITNDANKKYITNFTPSKLRRR